MHSRRSRGIREFAAFLVVAGAFFAAPAVAKAPYVELAGPSASATPSCDGTPANDRGKPNGLGRCSVLTMTTLFPAKDGGVVYPTRVAQNGKLVAWSLRLGILKDTRRCLKYGYKSQGGKRVRVCLTSDDFLEKTYFDKNFGRGSRARLVVLRVSKGATGTFPRKVVALGPEVRLEPWFGKSPTFALDRSIPVLKGDIIALSVPTYAPVLPIVSSGTTDNWRSSRPPRNYKPIDPATGKVVTIDPETKKPADPCSTKWGVIFKETATTTIGPIPDFKCSYPGAPTFKFLMIPNPA